MFKPIQLEIQCLDHRRSVRSSQKVWPVAETLRLVRAPANRFTLAMEQKSGAAEPAIPRANAALAQRSLPNMQFPAHCIGSLVIKARTAHGAYKVSPSSAKAS